MINSVILATLLILSTTVTASIEGPSCEDCNKVYSPKDVEKIFLTARKKIGKSKKLSKLRSHFVSSSTRLTELYILDEVKKKDYKTYIELLVGELKFVLRDSSRFEDARKDDERISLLNEKAQKVLTGLGEFLTNVIAPEQFIETIHELHGVER